ncbi:molecular chaperone DnaJ [Marinobacter persicus]|uniref:J domain-containing protein n=1 Tax=Marinobacter persicus TaxID=930118 RepID=A0A2S6G5E9_9GAMM|nr:molecular chaperone DnaJ [Marinobacter persicus]PPK50781.1 hypothetical protein BY455_12031 [Marinobacter persicus]PPK54233.1 hypothetical protein B0H24_101731 [Marinobacter persicus]PPK57369.1 hypothetical protein BY454_12131 [Marinobacter persicus]
MNCWEILGIEPTNNRDRIREAYDRQMKFASGEDAQALDRAFREATGEVPPTSEPVAEHSEEVPRSEPVDDSLDANDAQIAREVVIQIRALLNDDRRQQDVGIWKAILCEPPADQLPVRREIARSLEPQLRPMAENGSFPQPVAKFLGDWFDWFSVSEANRQPVPDQPDPRNYPEPGVGKNEDNDEAPEQPPQMMNFWPAVIGWIVGLAILASIFGGMSGG